MKPVSPVVKGFEDMEVVFAKDQSEYLPLPALLANDGNQVITRWQLSRRERLLAILRGDLYLTVMTFRQPLQPISLSLERPELRLV